MANYNLTKLVNYFDVLPQYVEQLMSYAFVKQPILHLRLDSRQVQAGDLFIALPGQANDGRCFINQALAAGAIAILAETSLLNEDKTLSSHWVNDQKIIQINIYQLADKLSAFARLFYDNPSAKIPVIGVTGTNGKTTVTQLIAQWTTLLGKKSAVLGTLGNGIYGQLTPAVNTTASAVDVQSYLADFVSQHVELVAMEVSSHGLALGRVSDVTFAVSLFTNLSRDHLDFHQTMANYQRAKWSLFSPLAQELAVTSSGHRVINFDDQVGLSWINQLPDVLVVSAISDNLQRVQSLGKPYVAVSSLTYHERGVTIVVASSFGDAVLESPLFGAFNVTNILLAMAGLLSLGYDLATLVKHASDLSPICGRMEIFTAPTMPTVIVDYAHTPDALDKALSTAKAHCQNQLWVVFGCGGDRDRGKRPLMAQVAQAYTPHIVVTNDNPRTENQEQIIADIVVGFSQRDTVQVITDRAHAIEWAIRHAKHNDIILVAGKGHEDYQIIGNTKYHYSDRETVSHHLGITL